MVLVKKNIADEYARDITFFTAANVIGSISLLPRSSTNTIFIMNQSQDLQQAMLTVVKNLPKILCP